MENNDLGVLVNLGDSHRRAVRDWVALSVNRVACPQCGALWRESCVECAEDTAARHRRTTGHDVELTVIQDDSSDIGTLMRLTRQAHAMLYRRW